jgi:type IV secretion system protein VirB11
LGQRCRCFRAPSSESLPLSALSGIATLAGALRNQDVSRTHPLLSTELPEGERLQAVLPPAVQDGTVSLTIRKHSKSSAPLSEVNSRYTTTGWNEWQDRATETRERMEEALALFDAGDIEPFLAACVRSRLNMLMVGATGSGKTTMSKSLITAIPAA